MTTSTKNRELLDMLDTQNDDIAKSPGWAPPVSMKQLKQRQGKTTDGANDTEEEVDVVTIEPPKKRSRTSDAKKKTSTSMPTPIVDDATDATQPLPSAPSKRANGARKPPGSQMLLNEREFLNRRREVYDNKARKKMRENGKAINSPVSILTNQMCDFYAKMIEAFDREFGKFT